jgi:hypothetical protein
MLTSERHSLGKNIVVIGDGPSALAFAVKLKQKGVSNVTLVGPRLGEFVRPGDLVPDTFNRVSALITPLLVKPSKGFHLKDVERQLYTYAQKLNVSLIKMKFDSFTAQGELSLVCDRALQPAQIMKVDVVIDCTGEQRSVIHSFNNRSGAGARFEIKSRPELSNKTYSLVRGVFKTKDAKEMRLIYSSKKAAVINDKVNYCLTIERLRQLGWKSYVAPLNYTNFVRSTLKSNQELIKGNIYTCVPDDIAQENILTFVKDTVKLIHGHDFTLLETKNPKKSNITKFSVNLQHVTPGYYRGDENFPVIIHAGDASINVPFMLALGVRESMERIQDIFDTFTIENGLITQIDYKKFDVCYATRLNLVNYEIDSYIVAIARRSDPGTVFPYAKQVHDAAYNTCTDIKNKEIIEAAKNNLDRQYALFYLEEGKEEFNKIHINKLETKDFQTLIAQLQRATKKLLIIMQYKHLFSLEKINEIEAYFGSLAEQMKSVAQGFFNSPKPSFNLASNNYSAAIDIYHTLLPDKSHERQLPLYSNLIIISRKQNDFAVCEIIFNSVKSRLYATTNQHKTLWDKIYYNTALAKLSLAEAMKKTSNYDEAKLDILYEEIDALKDSLSENSKEFAKTISNRLNISKTTNQNQPPENKSRLG